MSIAQAISVATHPIVLRFAEMFPAELAGYLMHAKRLEKDLRHVDGNRTHLNKLLLGAANWHEQVLAEIELMRHENLAEELDALKQRNRTREMATRAREGLKDPWRSTSSGPLREVILTANKDWFEDPAAPSIWGAPKEERELEFKHTAVDWLKSRFGDDVVHARVDHDERTCHIHAILMPRTEKVSKRRGRQKLLQPSVHPLLKDYEKAQDDVGEYFSAIGLRRGERSKEARRRAMESGLPVPEMREHIPPSRWREEEALRLKKEFEKIDAEREALAKRSAEIARQQANLNAEIAKAKLARRRADRREAEAKQCEAEADAVLAVAEAVECGMIDAGDVDGEISFAPRSALSNAQSEIANRIAGGGDRSRGLIKRFGQIFTRMSNTATSNAEKKLRQEFALAREAISLANRLRKKLVTKLRPEDRSGFLTDISVEDGRLNEIRNELDRIDHQKKSVGSEIDRD